MNRLPARPRRPRSVAAAALLSALAACAAPPTPPLETPGPDPEIAPEATRPDLAYELAAAFTTPAEFETAWGSALPAAPTRFETFTGLRRPHAVIFDGRGRLVISDPGYPALIRIDRGEKRIELLGAAGRGRLARPLGLGAGPDGLVFVADADRHEVLAFDDSGSVTERYGGPFDLIEPVDVAASPDGTRLFVSDAARHRILVFDRASGKHLETLGRQGRAAGDLFYPSGLAFDRQGRLVVADQGNSRIQLLSESGGALEVWEKTREGRRFDRPRDVAVDEEGRVYVTDYDRGTLEVLTADGGWTASLGGRGREPGSFHGLSGVAARADEVVAVDSLGGRLQIFRPRAATPAAARDRVAAAAASEPPAPAPPPPTDRAPSGVVVPAEPAPAPREPLAAAPPAPEPVTEEPVPAPPPAAAVERARTAVAAWARAWAGQDVAAYLSFYAARFQPPDGAGREAWEEQRRRRLAAPRFIEVTLEEVEVEVTGPGEARARFLQSYRSDRYADRVVKTLDLALEDGEWKIVAERAEEAP